MTLTALEARLRPLAQPGARGRFLAFLYSSNSQNPAPLLGGTIGRFGLGFNVLDCLKKRNAAAILLDANHSSTHCSVFDLRR